MWFHLTSRHTSAQYVYLLTYHCTVCLPAHTPLHSVSTCSHTAALYSMSTCSHTTAQCVYLLTHHCTVCLPAHTPLHSMSTCSHCIVQHVYLLTHHCTVCLPAHFQQTVNEKFQTVQKRPKTTLFKPLTTMFFLLLFNKHVFAIDYSVIVWSLEGAAKNLWGCLVRVFYRLVALPVTQLCQNTQRTFTQTDKYYTAMTELCGDFKLYHGSVLYKWHSQSSLHATFSHAEKFCLKMKQAFTGQQWKPTIIMNSHTTHRQASLLH